MNEAANRGGLEPRRDPIWSPLGPAIAAPKAAAFVLAECDARPGAPIVFVNDHTGRRRVFVALVGVPADAAGADNRRRCAQSGKSHEARADCRTDQSFAQGCHLNLRWMHPEAKLTAKVSLGSWQ